MTAKIVVISSYPQVGEEPHGGVEVHSVRLVEALAQAGAEVAVVAPGPASDERVDGVRIVHVHADWRLSLPRRLLSWRRAASAAVERVGCDAVHGQGLPAAGLAATDVRGLPRLVTAHGNHAMDTRAARRGVGAAARIALARSLSAAAVGRADAVVSVHPDPAVNVPGRPRRFAYIPSIVDDTFFAARRRPEPERLLYCGGPRAIKGADLLAAAWPIVLRRLPGARLHVVGWPATTALPGALAGAEVDGWLAPVQLREALERATAVVVPSRFEVAPVTLLEAWAAGTPVVATRVGGIPGLAAGAAVLVDPAPEAIAAGLVGVLTGGGGGDALVAEGRHRAAPATAAQVATAHLELYDRLLSR